MQPETTPFWGWQLIIDAGKLLCDTKLLNDVDYLKRFITDLLVTVDMKAWNEPVIMKLTDTNGTFPNSLSGYTIVQLLHTSSLTLIVHLCDKTSTLYLDLFSCRQFETKKAIEVLHHYFQPQSVRVNFLTRQA